jgi:hypothetical protein
LQRQQVIALPGLERTTPSRNLGLIEDKGWISALDHEGVSVCGSGH